MAVPSGAFGGSEDWSLSSAGHVAFSARPPLAADEAWTTNRHIYLRGGRASDFPVPSSRRPPAFAAAPTATPPPRAAGDGMTATILHFGSNKRGST